MADSDRPPARSRSPNRTPLDAVRQLSRTQARTSRKFRGGLRTLSRAKVAGRLPQRCSTLEGDQRAGLLRTAEHRAYLDSSTPRSSGPTRSACDRGACAANFAPSYRVVDPDPTGFGTVISRRTLSTVSRACFAPHLIRNQTAVLAALETPWSNGQVEGQVHRLKLIKARCTAVPASISSGCVSSTRPKLDLRHPRTYAHTAFTKSADEPNFS